MPAENNGAICTVDPAEEWPEDEYPFISVSTLGLPLAEISSAGDLLSKVVEPLQEVAGNGE